MFGAYRYFLCLLVVFFHTTPRYGGGGFSGCGVYAVLAFFILSGYLMTRILHERYGFDARGIRDYALNRALRVYPVYWLSLAAAIAMMIVMPDSMRARAPYLVLPHGIVVWLKNIFILGCTPWGDARLVPQAWSLNVELLYYALIALVLVRWRRLIPVWFAVSAAYVIYLVAVDASFNDRYSSPLAASLCFSLGALLFWIGRPGRWHHGITVVAAVAFFVHAMVAHWVWGDFQYRGMYISMGLCAVLQVGLSMLEPAKAPAWLSKLDTLLGDLSYPVYLSHQMILVLAGVVLGLPKAPSGIMYFFLCLPFINAVSYLMYRAADVPTQVLRERVRAHAASRQVPQSTRRREPVPVVHPRPQLQPQPHAQPLAA